MSDIVTFHVFDKEGNNKPIGQPTSMEDKETIARFIFDNVEVHHELRIVDQADNTIFHVVDQTLVFPIPVDGSARNKWDPTKKKFVTLP